MSRSGRLSSESGSSVTSGYALSRRAFLRGAAGGTALLGLSQLTGGLRLSIPGGNGAAVAAATPDPVAQLAAALDYDAERIFRFVADEIRYEPYDGVLRGARGALASRAGNSADQAVLLAALLEASLLPVRFATGEIDGDTVDAIMAGTEMDLQSIREHGLRALSGALPGSDPEPPDLTPEQQAQLDRAVANADAVVGWAREQLESTVGMIADAIEEAGVELLDGFTAMPDSERARHIWVQMAATADWLDLDPTLPAAEMGRAAASPSATMDDLPAELAHQVEISVIGEALGEGGPVERLLVGVRERADVLAGQPIMILNTSPDALTALGVSVAGALEGGNAYVPLIMVGNEAIIGANPIHFGSGASADGDTAGQGDFFEPGPAVGEATAEWVELTIRSPEREPVVVRRELFDRLGPGRRAAGNIATADLTPVARVEVPDRPGEHPLIAMATQWLTVNTGLPSSTDDVMAIVPGEDGREGSLMSQLFHLVNAAATVEVAAPTGVRPFVDSPNVTGYSMAVRPGDDGEQLLQAAVDIWHRGHGTAPVSGIEGSLPPSLAAGVLSHVAERVLGLDDNLAETAGIVSVGALFDRARAQGIGLRTLRGAGGSADLPLPADARARLDSAVADGWIAIVPEEPVEFDGAERSGWWLVDPHTGRTVDQLDDGRGGEPLEYAVTQEIPLSVLARIVWRRVATCLIGAIAYVEAALLLGLGAVLAQQGQAGVAFGSGLGAGVGLGVGAGFHAFC